MVTVNQFMLDGDVAVITGAGSGIGEGTAHVLANAGARIVSGVGHVDAIPLVPHIQGDQVRGGVIVLGYEDAPASHYRSEMSF